MAEHSPETGWTAVTANGLQHACFIDGEGPLVVLQHGFPDTPHTWDHTAQALVHAGFRVVRPFGRGITPSEAPAGDAYGAQELGADILGIIEALGEPRAFVVGHDWGASAAWAAAHLAPERIIGLVAMAIPHPATLRPSPAKLWGARHFVAFRLTGAVQRFEAHDFAAIRTMYERWAPDFDWPDDEFAAAKNAYRKPGCARAALGYYRALGLWPFSGSVKTDTLVIGGLTDGVATTADFERSRSRVEGPCEVRMLPGGHFMHREHPGPFVDALLDWLSRRRTT